MGSVFLLFAWGDATGISLASYAHDYLGSYRIAIELFIGLALLSIIIALQLGPYPYPPRRTRATEVEDGDPVVQAPATIR